MWDGFASYGDLEIVNSQRAFVLAKNASAGYFSNPRHPEIEDAIAGADFLDYTTSPWYDSDRDELSSRFYGVLGLRFDGVMDSTRQVVVTQNSGDGGVNGAPRRGTRAITVRAAILAKGIDALEYGRAWLAAALAIAGCEQDQDCDRADMLFFVKPPADFDEALDYSRYLKNATVVSGPFTVEQSTNRGFYHQEVEWSWSSERPFIFGRNRAIELDIAQSFALIQDAPINYFAYPSATLEEDESGAVLPLMATNLYVSPSVPNPATGWSASSATVSGSSVTSYRTGARDDGAAAIGATSFMARIHGNESTSASGVSTLSLITPTVTISGVPAGRYIQLGLWAKKAILAGATTAMTDLDVEAVFLTAGDVLVTTTDLVADDRGDGFYSLGPMAIPATAAKVYIQAKSNVTWASGGTDATNSDARIYAEGYTVAQLGSV